MSDMSDGAALAGLVAVIQLHGQAEVDHMREIAVSLSEQLQETQEECAYWKSIATDYATADVLRERANDRYMGGSGYGRGSM